MERNLALAERLVEKASGRGVDGAECWVDEGASLDVEVERGKVTGTGLGRSRGGALRVLVDGRLGFAYFTHDNQADLALDQAITQARRAPARPFDLATDGPAPDMPWRWDPDVAHLEPDAALALAGDVVQGAQEAAPDAIVGAGVSLGWHTVAIANSNGVRRTDRATHIQAMASLILEDEAGNVNAWESSTRHAGKMDAVAVGRRAGQTLTSLRGPSKAKTGRADLVFRPPAAIDLLGLIGQAVDGDTALRNKSMWSGRLGEPVAHKGVQVTDDPRHADGIGTTPFDGEGAATQARRILQDGVLQTYVFDARDAAFHGQTSTQNAVRDGFKAPPSTGLHHLVIDHSTRLPEDKLVAGIDDGYLVDSVLGAHTANATTGDFSVTAANVWRIKRGAVVGASKEVAIGGNLTDLLGRMDAASTEAKAMDGALVPSVRIRDMQVSA